MNTVTLYTTAAHVAGRTAVGINHDSRASWSSKRVGSQYQASRAAVRQAFGNAKARRTIESTENRMVDPQAVGTVIDGLQESIEVTSELRFREGKLYHLVRIFPLTSTQTRQVF